MSVHDISPAMAMHDNEAALAYNRTPALPTTAAASLREVGRVHETLRLGPESMVKAPEQLRAEHAWQDRRTLGMHGLPAMCDQLHAAVALSAPENDRRRLAVHRLTAPGYGTSPRLVCA